MGASCTRPWLSPNLTDNHGVALNTIEEATVRKVIVLIWLVSILFAAGPSQAKSNWPDAYSRRDYQLGISIAEFRNIRHPDHKEWPNAFPICSDEQRAKDTFFIESLVTPSANWRKAGVIKCRYFWDDGRGKSYSLGGAGLVLGDLAASTDYFFFSPCNNCMPVLFWIETSGPTSSFNHIAGLFRTAYGAPHSTQNEVVQNQIGNTFPKTVIQYRNAVSTMTLEQYGETLKEFRLLHTLTPVSILFEKALEAINKGKASKL